jgi:hypothetical protein
MRNLTLTIHFCDISQSFVSATKYENCTSTYQNGDAVYLFVVGAKNYCCRLSTQSRFAFYPLRGGVTPLDFVAREIKTVHLAIEATHVQEVSARRQARLAFDNVRENKFRHFFAGAGVQNCKDVRKAANSD